MKLKENIYWVGALNPAMRIFDIIMQTDYGTSYNSYLVKGEKTALIETSHNSFKDKFFANIAEITPLEKIDYIIINHCEPDHTGALASLVQINPNAEIYCTPAASKNLKAITNIPDLNVKIVKTGDSLDLGNGKILEFYSAPMLHWPDTMFTYLPADKILFPCDFFGAHFCEPYVFDSQLTYIEKYKKSLDEYYGAIFSPFNPFVRKGIEIFDKLDVEMICNSHGPVLTKGNLLEYAVKRYTELSVDVPPTDEIPVFFCSAYGNTKKLAISVADGIEKSGHKAKLYDLNDYKTAELSAVLNSAKAIALGSPTINSDAVAPVWNLLAHVNAIGSRQKPIFVFGSFGWSGEGVPNIIGRLKGLNYKVFGDGVKVNFTPDDTDLQNITATAEEFGKSV